MSEPDPRDLLTKQLAAARAKMEKLSSGFMLMVAEASDAEKQAYRKIANALSDEIMALEQALRDLPSAKRATEDVEAWRAEFSRVDLGGLIDGLLATDQRGKLRHGIAGVVDQPRLMIASRRSVRRGHTLASRGHPTFRLWLTRVALSWQTTIRDRSG